MFNNPFLYSVWTVVKPRVTFSFQTWYCFCCSVSKLCLILCHPMDCNTLDFPVLHCLLEFAQIHVHWVSDAIQPSHPLLSPSTFAFNQVLYSHRIFKKFYCPFFCCDSLPVLYSVQISFKTFSTFILVILKLSSVDSNILRPVFLTLCVCVCVCVCLYFFHFLNVRTMSATL